MTVARGVVRPERVRRPASQPRSARCWRSSLVSEGVRAGVQRHLGYQAGIACGGLEVEAPTTLRVTVPVKSSAGSVQLLGITSVAVASGAPPSPALLACVRGLLPAPLTLPGPVEGRWPRPTDAEGDVLVIIARKPRP